MGAAVILFNRQERLSERVLTDDRGGFRFLGLTPDLYSVKVTLAAFVPAIKKGIQVQPGMASVLNVNLNTLFSSIQFAYPPIDSGGLMSDEWRWVLRSASHASGTSFCGRYPGEQHPDAGHAAHRGIQRHARSAPRVGGRRPRGQRHRQRGRHGDRVRCGHIDLREQ
jgi:hypothetical protein